MNKKVDIFLTIISLTLLSLAFIAELTNLIGVGMQENYLQYPEGLDGENFKKSVEIGRLKLAGWMILTIILLTLTIYSRAKKNRKLFNRTTLITFIVTIYLPLLTIANGLIARGFVMLLVLIGLIAIVLFQIKREKTLARTSAIGNGG